jgi:hypothetical protein
MSFLLKCDICGKAEDSKSVKFDSRPIMLQIKNHKKQPYNVFVSVNIEHAADTAFKENLYENRNDVLEKMMLEAFKNGAMMSVAPGQQVQQIPIDSLIQSKLKNPTPVVCKKCKRIIAQYAVNYGADGELVKF